MPRPKRPGRRERERRGGRELMDETESEIGRRNRPHQASLRDDRQVAGHSVARVRTGSNHRWMAAVNARVPKHKSQEKHRK